VLLILLAHALLAAGLSIFTVLYVPYLVLQTGRGLVFAVYVNVGAGAAAAIGGPIVMLAAGLSPNLMFAACTLATGSLLVAIRWLSADVGFLAFTAGAVGMLARSAQLMQRGMLSALWVSARRTRFFRSRSASATTGALERPPAAGVRAIDRIPVPEAWVTIACATADILAAPVVVVAAPMLSLWLERGASFTDVWLISGALVTGAGIPALWLLARDCAHTRCSRACCRRCCGVGRAAKCAACVDGPFGSAGIDDGDSDGDSDAELDIDAAAVQIGIALSTLQEQGALGSLDGDGDVDTRSAGHRGDASARGVGLEMHDGGGGHDYEGDAGVRDTGRGPNEGTASPVEVGAEGDAAAAESEDGASVGSHGGAPHLRVSDADRAYLGALQRVQHQQPPGVSAGLAWDNAASIPGGPARPSSARAPGHASSAPSYTVAAAPVHAFASSRPQPLLPPGLVAAPQLTHLRQQSQVADL
jgi:hypothetical protein